MPAHAAAPAAGHVLLAPAADEPKLTSVGHASYHGVGEHEEQASVARLKFQYIVSCQVYGEMVRAGDPAAAAIGQLLRRHPDLRVAYIDEVVKDTQHSHSSCPPRAYFSVLLKARPRRTRTRTPVPPTPNNSQEHPSPAAAGPARVVDDTPVHATRRESTRLAQPPACVASSAADASLAAKPTGGPRLSSSRKSSSTDRRITSSSGCSSDSSSNNDSDDGGVDGGQGGLQEVYRVQLPGKPVLGEGKPENQNHALVFTRGELVQTVDMNQEGLLEDALKMRNLLHEFTADPEPATCSDDGACSCGQAPPQPPTIVGFREHVFTGSLSAVANFMALQEGVFAALGQRVLDDPLRARFHYGHPDVFDKLFCLPRGGVSKASKGINLSEDIFAGYNNLQRGGRVVFREYISLGKGRDVGLQQLFQFEAKLAQGAAMQFLSRDVHRLVANLDFARLLSFFYGGIGFYLGCTLTVHALFVFLYGRFFISALQLADPVSDHLLWSMAYWIGLAGFLMVLPVCAFLGAERGVGRMLAQVGVMIFSGGPLYFLFQLGTKMHFFERTLMGGGAQYRPTGRDFVTRRDSVDELYRCYAFSHFYKAVELLGLLSLYGFTLGRSPNSFALTTWSSWLVVLSWLGSPFWFNPMGLQLGFVAEDAQALRHWLFRGGDWAAWFSAEVKFVSTLPAARRLRLALSSLRHCLVSFVVLVFWGISLHELLFWAVLCAFTSTFATAASCTFSETPEPQPCLRATRLVAWLAATALAVVLAIRFVDIPSISFMGESLGLAERLSRLCVVTLAVGYAVVGSTNAALYLGWQWTRVFWLGDVLLTGSLLAVLGVFALLKLPSLVQSRFLFHDAFSQGSGEKHFFQMAESAAESHSRAALKETGAVHHTRAFHLTHRPVKNLEAKCFSLSPSRRGQCVQPFANVAWSSFASQDNVGTELSEETETTSEAVYFEMPYYGSTADYGHDPVSAQAVHAR